MREVAIVSCKAKLMCALLMYLQGSAKPLSSANEPSTNGCNDASIRPALECDDDGCNKHRLEGLVLHCLSVS